MRLARLACAAAALLLPAAAQAAAPFNAHQVALELIATILRSADCAGCQSVLTTLKGVAETGDKNFDAVLIDVCEISKAEPNDVCTGLIKEQGPILAEQLRRMTIGSHTAVYLCATLLGLCSYPAVVPYNISLPAPKHRRTRPTPSGKQPIHVVHVSDTHVDLDYVTGSSYSCDYPICCRVYNSSDAPGNTSTPCGPWGNTACDPPLRLERSMFDAINTNFPDAKFTIFTGDVPAHDVWLVNRREVSDNLRVTYNEMKTLPRVYPAVGNHDTSPVNAFPPKQLFNYAAVNPQWSYNIFSKFWQQWIGTRAANSADNYGSYSSVTRDGRLRIISFNSVLYYVLDFWNYADPMPLDPSGQFAWLVNELQEAETLGQRAWLISHVPSGSSDFIRDYSNTFDKIINRYAGTIAACFYGHTHQDQLELAYSDYSERTFYTASMVSYIVPSLTPTSGSPGFRVYVVDPVTYAVLDYQQWIANISSPSFQHGPTWELYYAAKAAYGPYTAPPVTDPHAELSPAFWHNVTNAFVLHDGVFQQYYKRKTRGLDPNLCGKICKSAEMCGIRAANSEFNCVEPTPGLNFGKRDLEQLDECGENLFRRLFMKIQSGAYTG